MFYKIGGDLLWDTFWGLQIRYSAPFNMFQLDGNPGIELMIVVGKLGVQRSIILHM